MDFNSISAAFRLPADVSATDRIVLIALAERSNTALGEYGCFPSIDYLTGMTALSRRTVQASIGRLKDRGLLNYSVRKTTHGDGRFYRLTIGATIAPIDTANGATIAPQTVQPCTTIGATIAPERCNHFTPNGATITPDKQYDNSLINKTTTPPCGGGGGGVDFESLIDDFAALLEDKKPERDKWRDFISKYGYDTFRSIAMDVLGNGRVKNRGASFNKMLDNYEDNYENERRGTDA